MSKKKSSSLLLMVAAAAGMIYLAFKSSAPKILDEQLPPTDPAIMGQLLSYMASKDIDANQYSPTRLRWMASVAQVLWDNGLVLNSALDKAISVSFSNSEKIWLANAGLIANDFSR